MRVNKNVRHCEGTPEAIHDFVALCDQGKIISNHGIYGPKVVLMPDGDYIKVFNPKSGFTKRHFFPKYKSFIKNAERLNASGIPCIQIKDIYYLSQNKAYAVRYSPLAGTDLRTLARQDVTATLEAFIPFLVQLHEKGIYFRGIHLANVLKLENGQYGLIDMADLYFKRRPLSIFTRARNLAHLFKNKDDAVFYQQYGIDHFMMQYLNLAKITGIRKRLFDFARVIVRRRPGYQY